MGKETSISPHAYAQWRESELGARTEALEKEAVIALTGSLSGLRVLDVGCGDGAYSIHAARFGATVTGLDISPAMLDAARQRADAAGVRVEWRGGRAEALPFPAASFDVVVAVTVLCWVSDPAAAVREMARVLRPGGIVVIGELGRYSLWAFVRRVRGWFGDRFWREAHFWTAKELRRLVNSARLMFGEVRGAVYYPPWITIEKLLAPLDKPLSKVTSTGAAFLCIRASKPLSSDGAREKLTSGLAHTSS